MYTALLALLVAPMEVPMHTPPAPLVAPLRSKLISQDSLPYGKDEQGERKISAILSVVQS